MRYIILTLHRDFLPLFGFLQANPTRCYKQGDYYRFIYREPLTVFFTPFHTRKAWLELAESTDGKLAGWELIRDKAEAYAGEQLLTVLQDLERTALRQKRQGTGVELSGWVLEVVQIGIHTRQDTARLVRLFFLAGYDMDEVIGVFSNLTKRTDLAPYFLQELTRIYKEEATA